MKKSFGVLLVGVLFAISAQTVFAHAVVRPSAANVGAYVVFTVNVPSEKEQPTVGVKLLLPEGLESVTPNVKQGWTITTNATEISWSGGRIPEHMRDEFAFQVKLPASETRLAWKVYQTYADGSVVAWDLAPGAEQHAANGASDFSSSGPYSTTEVLNDLAATPTKESETEKKSRNENIALVVSVAALVVAIWARMKKH